MTPHDLLAALHTPLFTLAGNAISRNEALGFVTGTLCVWLVARQNIWNWPIGLANNALFLLLFAATGLYADAGLQIVYIVLAVYGWWAWLFGSQAHAALAVSRTPRQSAIALAIAATVLTAGLTLVLQRTTNSTVPFWDALTTALSLVATYGQCRKQLESWWIWIAVDVVYIPLYASKGLHLTALLYVGYFLLCLMGERHWRRSLASATAPPADAALPPAATGEAA